jgi:hypothetical protein
MYIQQICHEIKVMCLWSHVINFSVHICLIVFCIGPEGVQDHDTIKQLQRSPEIIQDTHTKKQKQIDPG